MFNYGSHVAIIGAGPAGLGVGAELLDKGFAVTIYERHSSVGGVCDMDNPGSPVYDSAHLISSRQRSGFRGFPMPADFPDYPTRHQQLAYLRGFARARHLYDNVRFGAEVVSAARDPEGGWTLTFQDGDRESAGAVVVANGHLWCPRLPKYPGDFTGTTIHAVDYSFREQFAGKRVLVVGGGNSAVDIACDAAISAVSATISMRRGYHLVPKHLFGVPTDVFGHSRIPLPTALRQRLFGALVRLLVGDLQRFGVQQPDHPIMASHPIMNSQLVHHLRHGDITAKPDIAYLRGGTVHFSDGSSDEFDMIVWATGYQPTIPFIDETHLPTRDGAPDLFLRLMHRDYDDLFVAGLFEVDGSVNPTLSRQGSLVAAALRAACACNDAQLDALKRTDPELLGNVHHLDTERHSIYIQEEAYRQAVRRVLQRLDELASRCECHVQSVGAAS
jgi:hypothetical protein